MGHYSKGDPMTGGGEGFFFLAFGWNEGLKRKSRWLKKSYSSHRRFGRLSEGGH